MKKKYITAAEFDSKFDAGEDVYAHYDIEKAVRPGQGKQKVSNRKKSS